MTTPRLMGKNARWAMKLQEYDFRIRHRPGKTMQHVDGLSCNLPPPEPTATLILLAKEVELRVAKGSRGPADIWEDEPAMRVWGVVIGGWRVGGAPCSSSSSRLPLLQLPLRGVVVLDWSEWC
ncbi:unnamed protein product [Closterium sp. NIES-54]